MWRQTGGAEEEVPEGGGGEVEDPARTNEKGGDTLEEERTEDITTEVTK